MPELPEVETIRLYLTDEIKGKTVEDIEILEPKQFIGNKEEIIGAKITGIQRKGKVLAIALDNNKFLNIHLKMSGQILFAKNKGNAVYAHIIPKTFSNKMPGSTTRIIITFKDNSVVFYNDLRKFGWIKISDKPLVPDSVDVLSPDFTLEYFKNTFSKLNKPVKPVLMEQNLLAGVGNIYANDSCWTAEINPLRKIKTLTSDELSKLYKAIKSVIADGIKYKGSSSKDESFIAPDGSRGNYQHHFKVYSRENQPCTRCQNKIIRIKQGGRSTFYCENCQK